MDTAALKDIETWATLILATGALGTAAFGVVDGLKAWRIGLFGFGSLETALGKLTETLKVAYGTDWKVLTQHQYRDGRGSGPLRRTLRQGVRIGLRAENAAEIRKGLGLPDLSDDKLKEAIEKVNAGANVDDPSYRVVGRYELAADARVTAALGVAEAKYKSQARLAAAGVAIVLAIFAGAVVTGCDAYDWRPFFASVLIGLAAVPVAPVAKDLATGLKEAARAMQARP